MSASNSAPEIDLEKGASPLLAPAPINLSWSDLTFRVNGKVILDGVSGELASGHLLAVMGPSGKCTVFPAMPITYPYNTSQTGAGKSTFLDVLNEHFFERLI